MNIVLVGMRGSGKTTVGRILAQRLKRGFVEMDELIAQKTGLSIPEIVARHGWDKFRDVEAGIAKEIARLDNQVIVTGGGVVTREGNIHELKNNGVMVWLEASVDELVKRIGQDTTRPPLVSGRTTRGDIEITLRERVPLYRKAADLVVSTENRTPESIAIEIIGLLLAQGHPVAHPNTRICCLVGNPVAYSLSPLVHNAGYEALGLDFIYVPFHARDIKQAIDIIKAQGIHGVSVTIPYKTAVVSYLDSIDEAARGIGAVNTIVNNNGTLTGFNTDGIAAVKALEETISLEGKKAVLVGAGGAAAAIAVGLKKKGAELVILNRTVEKARDLARLVNAEASGGLEELPVVSSADIILINATSVGMWPKINESIIPRELLHDRLTVFDIVYNPKETRLLREAREKGGTIVYGYKMFLYQAAIQFELFTGCQAPLAVMERATLSALGG